MKISKQDSLFCSRPFKWFEVSQGQRRGDVFMCCPGWLPTSIGNLLRLSVDEIWNGEKAQKIRRSVLDGSFRYCNKERCTFLQTLTGPVQKNAAVTDGELRWIIAKELTELPHGPAAVKCSYDRSCNLSCPSCRATVIVETGSKSEILQIQGKIQREVLKDAVFLYITGSGDPFGSPFYRKWLQTMDKQTMPRLQDIRLHTNAQLWTPPVWRSIPSDVRRTITSTEISVDAATAKTYSVNRRGGSFLRLLQNFKFISRLRQKGPLKSVTISMVVQANNFREMPDFVRLGRYFNFDIVYFSQLVNWGTYSSREFEERAVHLPSHPAHGELLNLLKEAIFQSPIVNLGNLTTLSCRAKPAEERAVG